MIGVDVGVEGASDLKKKLDDLKRRASPEQIGKALVAGGQVIKQAIVERTPERVDIRSGDALSPGELRGDIHVKLYLRGGTNVSVHVGPSKKTAKVMRWLEFGHTVVLAAVALGRRKRLPNGTTQVPAHPVMRPAYEASRNEALRVSIQKLKELLEG